MGGGRAAPPPGRLAPPPGAALAGLRGQAARCCGGAEAAEAQAPTRSASSPRGDSQVLCGPQRRLARPEPLGRAGTREAPAPRPWLSAEKGVRSVSVLVREDRAPIAVATNSSLTEMVKT